ncbi:MAG: nucleotide pyrophosphohydrolase [Planctomycetes bacterium]|nr:nucleotide pyrophosphohydrolase [Planctomycetota bacterium]
MADTLQELQELVVRFRDERDWEQFHTPKDLVLGLQVEAAELAELFLWRASEQTAEDFEQAEFRDRLQDELADVQTFLLYLAQAAGVDLAAAVRAKLKKNAAKYPVEKARGSARKYDQLN